MSDIAWKYKTVHFALKKDGILGGSFLDEAEIEQTLNNMGQEGWELVSFLDGSEGLFGVFKQMSRQPNGVAEPVFSPLPQNEQHEFLASSFHEEEKPEASCPEEDDAAQGMTENLETELLQEKIVVEEEAETTVVATEAVFVSVHEEDLSSGTGPEQEDNFKEPDSDCGAAGIGSIRIE